ncbi:MAG: glycosyltransferase family A protein [Actinomycetota bacterium]
MSRDSGTLSRGPTVAVLIATCARPKSVERALQSISEQEFPPAAVLVVDASEDRSTEFVCSRMTGLFPPDVLRYERSERGLPRQREFGIEHLRPLGLRYLCMMDDDVTLAPDFLSECLTFLESPEGNSYGGVSGYSMIGWGRPFDRLERLYKNVGLYEGELRPGRWLYCGRLLMLSHLDPFEGIHRADYIPGTHAVWRMDVFDKFMPPRDLAGWALWEDVHLSLRVATQFKVGVLGEAHAWHHHAPGGRPGRIRRGFQNVRRQALMLRDCDPRPTRRRYAAFLAFAFLDLFASAIARLARLRSDALPSFVGGALGWLTCVVRPPAHTSTTLRRGRAHPRRSFAPSQR